MQNSPPTHQQVAALWNVAFFMAGTGLCSLFVVVFPGWELELIVGAAATSGGVAIMARRYLIHLPNGRRTGGAFYLGSILLFVGGMVMGIAGLGSGWVSFSVRNNIRTSEDYYAHHYNDCHFASVYRVRCCPVGAAGVERCGRFCYTDEEWAETQRLQEQKDKEKCARIKEKRPARHAREIGKIKAGGRRDQLDLLKLAGIGLALMTVGGIIQIRTLRRPAV